MESDRPVVVRADGTADGDGTRVPTGTVRNGDVYIRNHDYDYAYDLAIAVTDGDGVTVFEELFYVQPGQSRSVDGVPEPGEYDVTVELDGRESKTVRCRVDRTPAHTIHVELGNGIVSVTEGIVG